MIILTATEETRMPALEAHANADGSIDVHFPETRIRLNAERGREKPLEQPE